MGIRLLFWRLDLHPLSFLIFTEERQISIKLSFDNLHGNILPASKYLLVEKYLSKNCWLQNIKKSVCNFFVW